MSPAELNQTGKMVALKDNAVKDLFVTAGYQTAIMSILVFVFDFEVRGLSDVKKLQVVTLLFSVESGRFGLNKTLGGEMYASGEHLHLCACRYT